MHSHGVLTLPNKDRCSASNTRVPTHRCAMLRRATVPSCCRYEGQFENGVMHGAGAYVWSNGT